MDVLDENVDYRHNVEESHIHHKELKAYLDTDYKFLKIRSPENYIIMNDFAFFILPCVG